MIFGLFWLLGYQFSPRLADAGSARFWRIDSEANYGLLDNLARQTVKTELEEQLGTLGLVTNVLVLWNTYYMDAAINQLQKEGWEIKEEDKARLSPLPHSHINMLGRYQFNLPEELKNGALRSLRDVETIDELADLDFW